MTTVPIKSIFVRDTYYPGPDGRAHFAGICVYVVCEHDCVYVRCNADGNPEAYSENDAYALVGRVYISGTINTEWWTFSHLA